MTCLNCSTISPLTKSNKCKCDVCVSCGEFKPIYAKGLCSKCYKRIGMRQWRINSPDKAKAIQENYIKKHPERDIHSPEMQKKLNQARLNKIIRDHDKRHANDPDALDIRGFLGMDDDWAFRYL